MTVWRGVERPRSQKVVVLSGHPELTVDKTCQTPPNIPGYLIFSVCQNWLDENSGIYNFQFMRLERILYSFNIFSSVSPLLYFGLNKNENCCHKFNFNQVTLSFEPLRGLRKNIFLSYFFSGKIFLRIGPFKTIKIKVKKEYTFGFFCSTVWLFCSFSPKKSLPSK